MAATAASLAAGAGQLAQAPLNAIGNSRHLGGIRILGVTMLGIGAFIMVGALTGNLPAMIAALFYPSALANTGPSVKPTTLTKGTNPFTGQVSGESTAGTIGTGLTR